MSTRGPRLVLLGKQGAGKGTQAIRLSDYYHVAHLCTGDLFREAAARGTARGLDAKSYIDRGDLVPDDTVVDVVEEQLKMDGRVAGGFVLDGFPRTRRQAEELDRILSGLPLDLVINIDVATEVVLRRIAGRRVCSQCGALYHVDAPPTQNWTCDACGGHVVQREDDTDEAVMRRLDLYAIESPPLIQLYQRTSKLVYVDGGAGSDAVFRNLIETVESRFDPANP